MKDLPVLRKKLDNIDDQIVDLISERFRITREIGLIKANSRLPVSDENRERQIISRLAERSKSLSLNPDLIRSLYRSILSEVVLNHKELVRRGPILDGPPSDP